MNFRFTKLKVSATLILAVISTLVFLKQIGPLCQDCSPKTFQDLLIQASAFGLIVSLILIYVIWSLIQKKK